MQKFTTNIDRRADYFTQGGLQQKFGAPKEQWPLMLVKELVDNGLDAAERQGIEPVITVTIEADRFTVADNGPGLPASVVSDSLDYTQSTSSNVAFVSPSRGQLGNALKLVWAAGYVANGVGCVAVTSCGKRHIITAKANELTNVPDVQISHVDDCECEGTAIAIEWPRIARWFEDVGYTYTLCETLPDLLQCFAAGNPHATFHLVTADGVQVFSNTTQAKRPPLHPSKANHPHWYGPETWRRLLAAYISNEQRKLRTVREFIKDFDGLKKTTLQSQIAEQAGLSGKRLADLFDGDSLSFDPAIESLRSACCAAVSDFEPLRLGQLGEQCLSSFLLPFNDGGKAHYKKFSGSFQAASGAVLPYVFELAWVTRPERETRLTFVLLNSSPVFKIPSAAIENAFQKSELERSDPIALVLSLRCPEFNWDDTGKQQIALSQPVAQSLQDLITSCCEPWRRKKAAARRDATRSAAQRLKEQNTGKRTIKSALWEVLPQAYMQASADNTLPAHARQIFYQARPLVQRLGIQELKFKTFSDLLADFLNAYPEVVEDWDVIFDARGHATEPHTGRTIALGTKGVRDYIAQWRSPRISVPESLNLSVDVSTYGPECRFAASVYIEKEGFTDLIERSQIAKRYDLKIFSAKGVPTTSARQLAERLSDAGIPVFVVRDFDEGGFKIVNTLSTSNRRHKFKHRPNIIDLGLRLEDVEYYGLESEDHPWSQGADPRPRLRRYGCTEDEIDFLCRPHPWKDDAWVGHRVELNALSASDFLEWLESKLDQHGVKKVLPDESTLAAVYRRVLAMELARKVAEEALSNFDPSVIEVPHQLLRQVKDAIEGKPLSWDEAIADIARGDAA